MSNVVHFISKGRKTPLLQTATITLPKIRAVAVMFLSSGRNAWHRPTLAGPTDASRHRANAD